MQILALDTLAAIAKTTFSAYKQTSVLLLGLARSHPCGRGRFPDSASPPFVPNPLPHFFPLLLLIPIPNLLISWPTFFPSLSNSPLSWICRDSSSSRRYVWSRSPTNLSESRDKKANFFFGGPTNADSEPLWWYPHSTFLQHPPVVLWPLCVPTPRLVRATPAGTYRISAFHLR